MSSARVTMTVRSRWRGRDQSSGTEKRIVKERKKKKKKQRGGHTENEKLRNKENMKRE